MKLSEISPFPAYMLNSIGKKKYAVHDNIHFGTLLGNFSELLNRKEIVENVVNVFLL